MLAKTYEIDFNNLFTINDIIKVLRLMNPYIHEGTDNKKHIQDALGEKVIKEVEIPPLPPSNSVSHSAYYTANVSSQATIPDNYIVSHNSRGFSTPLPVANDY